MTFRNVTQNFTLPNILKTDITKYYVSADILNVGVKVLSCTADTITVDTDRITENWGETETDKNNLVMSIQLWRTLQLVRKALYGA